MSVLPDYLIKSIHLLRFSADPISNNDKIKKST